ncbi:hypothetical protein LTR62_002770 [Meristemomyces frigidus]|uniref:Uncharacterized protein n=1 Tax=Meristemomyces frigidus TaxID=1508187 RepID=A0AAN7T8L8_9PEZI|nr:hypothetical protein LTR62_002770 [Meristemomyces frigidus]
MVGVSETYELLAAEEYINEQPYTGGEIFRKIRLYHQQGSETNEGKWWARLSPTKAKELRQLLKIKQYATAFDSSLPWLGLWTPIHLGSLHRFLTLKCNEEILSGLVYVHEAWSTIVPSVLEHLSVDAVDAKTVQRLQGLNPGALRADAKKVETLMQEQAIFPRVYNTNTRKKLLQNILTYDDEIPSLFTFFETLKHLEPCAKILRALMPPNKEMSTRTVFYGAYHRPTQFAVEHDPHDFQATRAGFV